MSYSLTKTLPSCFIERKLVVELENYLRRKASEHAVLEEGQDNVFYEIIIKDSLGQERLTSIEDFQKAYFPDDTKLIRMKAGDLNYTIEIEITLGLGKSETDIEIGFKGKSAREITTGIAAEITSILKSYKTSNYWIHSSDWFAIIPGVGVIMAFVALCTTILGLIAISEPPPFNSLNALLLITTFGLFFSTFLILRRMKPYSVFETRLNERRQRQVNWLLLGFLGYILFTVIGVYFRNKLLGF
jgi:hypothetical protein